MPHKTHTFAAIALAGACAALFAFSSPVRAQDSQSQGTQSVADAARAARAAKKAKAAKVINDEDIDKTSYNSGGLNVGSAPSTDAVAPNAAEVKTDLKADEAQLAAETTATVKPGEDPAIARAKEELAAASAKLDLLKRANALDQDTYYSKPGYTTDHAGKIEARRRTSGDQRPANGCRRPQSQARTAEGRTWRDRCACGAEETGETAKRRIHGARQNACRPAGLRSAACAAAVISFLQQQFLSMRILISI